MAEGVERVLGVDRDRERIADPLVLDREDDGVGPRVPEQPYVDSVVSAPVQFPDLCFTWGVRECHEGLERGAVQAAEISANTLIPATCSTHVSTARASWINGSVAGAVEWGFVMAVIETRTTERIHR
jgi:hypothetical protein